LQVADDLRGGRRRFRAFRARWCPRGDSEHLVCVEGPKTKAESMRPSYEAGEGGDPFA